MDYNGNSVDFYFDDVCLRDDAYPGPGQVAVLLVNATGQYTNYTLGAGTSIIAAISERPPDGGSTYITTSGSGTQVSTFNLTDTASSTPPVTGTINCIKTVVIQQNNAGQANTIGFRIRSGSPLADNDSTAVDPGATYTLYAKLTPTVPGSSNAWTLATLATLDSLQLGPLKTQSQAREASCTWVGVMVDFFTPVVAGIEYLSMGIGM